MTPSPHLFQLGSFVLHSSALSEWKIDCDALTDADVAALAVMFFEILPPFGSVEGVPRGGLRLATALEPFATSGPVLIVDDVLTTGGSMEEYRAGRDAVGAVIFARDACPLWVTPLFKKHSRKVTNKLVTLTISVDRNGDVHNDTVTHGNSFAEVYRGFCLIRDEVQRQIDQRRGCPYNPKNGVEPSFED